ncbi:Phospholipase/Carboxylesterase [Mycolicibacterium chubuense NBB4]|uniref:Phospholipase/Carboxylesterase n=1 Tax=Mycolicibacterium chubuense (strain NBB4) TaxID=710421 RepID=I4BRG1_MYCCN|nr:alpha/beta fold hydrolase [Mycolicibacterium chubuense]AFM19868.1 Phospholipase/Carboxylesterase [Mycolicibacterium chubuense NBB4]
MNTVQYSPDRHADLFGEPTDPSVLLWHGAQSDARASVRTLAELLATRGIGVVAPDWDSHAPDRGASDLLASAAFAREWSAGPLVVVGWSMGGAAAAGLTLRASRHGVAVAHTVCLAGAFMVPDPISGADLTAMVSDERPGTPFTLLHGSADDVVPPEAGRRFAAALDDAGWPVQALELPADHGSIAGARYDAATDSYAAATDPHTLEVAGRVAGHIADAVGATHRR